MTVAEAIKNKVHPYTYAMCETREVSPEVIIMVVFGHYKLNPLDCYSGDRHKDISHARQVCMWVMRKSLRMSYPQIAKTINRADHTTIMHGVNSIDEQISVNKDMRIEVLKLRDSIMAMANTVKNKQHDPQPLYEATKEATG